MKICKLLLIDIRLGINKKLHWLSLIICYLFVSLMYVVNLNNFNRVNCMDYAGNWRECILYCFKGQMPFAFLLKNSLQSRFDLPIVWFTIMVLNMVLPVAYPSKALDLWGYQYLCRSGRKRWWISKYFYVLFMCILSGTIFMMVTGITCCLFGIPLSGNGGFEIVTEMKNAGILSTSGYINNIDFIYISIICPFLAIVTLCLIELLIAVFINPVLSLIFILTVLILSVYEQKYWLIGNYSMVIRSNLIDKNGLSFTTGIVVMLFMCLGVFFTGLRVIGQKDIIYFEKYQ